jgi:Protein of unknown function (DUF3307)
MDAMMTNYAVLVLILLLQIKHFICDGPLQTKAMVDGKSIYGNRLGLLHAGLHGLGSLVALAWFGLGWKLVLALAAADMVIHYHIDFTKENIVRSHGWTTITREFWWALAIDQFLHHLTYLALAAVIVGMA